MKTISLLYLFLTLPVFLYAQRYELDCEFAKPDELYKWDPKSRKDSLNCVVKDNGIPCATIIIKIVGNNIESPKFGGTIMPKPKAIESQKYCIYMLDDGKHDQYLKIDYPKCAIKEIKAGNDHPIPRFQGGKRYEISIRVKRKGPEEYDPAFKMYLGGGINPLLQWAPTVNVGFDWQRFNMWLSASHSIVSSNKLFVYDAANEQLGTHKFSYLRLGLNAGWEWEPWEQAAPLFSIMPQVGFALDCVYSNKKELDGNGFNAYNFVVGARFALKTNNRRFCFFATPELNLNLGYNPKKNYEEITGNINSLKKSFDIQLGVLYYF